MPYRVEYKEQVGIGKERKGLFTGIGVNKRDTLVEAVNRIFTELQV
jgi:hypothetical protein